VHGECGEIGVRPEGETVTGERPSVWGVPRLEYRLKNLEWSGRAALRRDPSRAAPHPHSPEVVDTEVRRRVAEELAPLFAEGWGYFGSYDRAVRPFTRPERGRWGRGERMLIEGCTVKLQRPNGEG
jgi:hypothetical protein